MAPDRAAYRRTKGPLYGGHTLFFCCGACARYFDGHAADVAALRRI